MGWIPETEQWQLDGDCDKCRRSKFCSKQCTANKRYESRKIARIATQVVANAFFGMAESEPSFPKK